ncbi:MAG: F0F1 ATP synthase subunit A [Gemmatimonadota bacterium]
MQLTPDQVVYWEWGFVTINATLVFTWLSMAAMVAAAWIVTRTLQTGPRVGRGQILLEIIVMQMRKQIGEVVPDDPDRYLPFIGTLFLFISVSTVLGALPGVHVVAASLSTAAALAACVFAAVPVFGISRTGVSNYLRHYVRPSAFMLPFHVIGELSRTLALAVRLFGNLMSGRVIVAIVLSVVPFIFPALLEAFGLLIGIIQSYVFAMLALVYVASGARSLQQEKSWNRSS